MGINAAHVQTALSSIEGERSQGLVPQQLCWSIGHTVSPGCTVQCCVSKRFHELLCVLGG